MPVWSSIFLQSPNSPSMEQMSMFHDYIMTMSMMIMIMIFYMMLKTVMNPIINKTLMDGQDQEAIWTALPAIVLLFVAFPSLRLLYMVESSSNPMMTVKIMAHQWYWSYQYSDLEEISFDSFMNTEMTPDSFRLLEPDTYMAIPILTNIRILLSSTDVLHAWTIPSLGVKMDAVPGRLNQLMFSSNRPGKFFGQCSEICGAKHSFMPIMSSAMPSSSFMKWCNLSMK